MHGEFYAERHTLWRHHNQHHENDNVRLGYFAMTLISLLAAAWAAFWLHTLRGSMFFWALSVPMSVITVVALLSEWALSYRERKLLHG